MVDWSTYVIQPVGQNDRAVADVLISYTGYKTEKLTLSSAGSGNAKTLKFQPVVLQKKRPITPPASGATDVVVLANP